MSLTFFKRFENFENYLYSSWTGGTSDQTDGVNIAKEVDQYCLWYYTEEALPGVHAAGKQDLCYLNIRDCDDRYSYYNPAFCLRNSSGVIVATKGYEGHLKVADPLNQLWRDTLASEISRFQSLGFTGLFLDNGVEVDVPDTYTFDSTPINPRTGQLYTDSDFVRDCVDMTNWLKAQFPNMYMVANGFWSGTRYNQTVSGHQYVMDNVQIEAIFSEGMWGNIYGQLWNVSDWVRSVNFLREIQNRWVSKGREFVTYTNCGGAGHVYSTPTASVQTNGEMIGWERAASFHFCSDLMAVNQVEGNIFSLHMAMSRPYVQDLFKVDVGVPLEDYHLLGNGIYTRKWSKIQPFVNPQQDTRSVSVAGMTLYDAIGNLVDSITIPAKTGLLLYQAESPPPDNVYLTYQSVPQGVPAEANGTPLLDGEMLEMPRGAVVKLKVPLRIDI